MLKYGIIGLGNLGEKIARNLINKGFSIKIFDKDMIPNRHCDAFDI